MRFAVIALACLLSASAHANPLLDEAKRSLGSSARDLGVRNNLWCAAALNKWLERIGAPGTGSDQAASFAKYGHKLPGPQIGAIAIMRRGKAGGHVGVVSGIEGSGVILISGNHAGRVREAVYPKSRIYSYVMP